MSKAFEDILAGKDIRAALESDLSVTKIDDLAKDTLNAFSKLRQYVCLFAETSKDQYDLSKVLKIYGDFNDWYHAFRDSTGFKDSTEVQEAVSFDKSNPYDEKWLKDVHKAAAEVFGADSKLWDLMVFAPRKYNRDELQDSLNAYSDWYQKFIKIKKEELGE